MPKVAMPRLSDSMQEATILAWLKSDGERVSRGDELAEVETDKASIVYEADVEGTLKVVARAGDTVPVGAMIAFIGDADAAAEEAQAGPRPAERLEPAVASSEPAAGLPGGGSTVKASPVTRRIARELRLELASVAGSGPGGRILKADVEAASRSRKAPAAPAEALAESRTHGEHAAISELATAATAPTPAPSPPAATDDQPGGARSATKISPACNGPWRGGWPSPRRRHLNSCSTST